MTSIIKSCFSSLNDKRYHFLNGIVLLPFSHPFLENARTLKKQFQRKIQNHIKHIKDKHLKEEYCVVNECEILRVLSSILIQPFTYYKLDSNKRHNVDKDFKTCATREYILNFYWL